MAGYVATYTILNPGCDVMRTHSNFDQITYNIIMGLKIDLQKFEFYDQNDHWYSLK